jgi:hypothetical protein
MTVLENRIRSATLALRSETASGRVVSALAALERRYREDQARIPQGLPGAGRWTEEDGGDDEADPRQVAEVIYVCTRVGSVPITDENDQLAYAVSYLCGFDNQLLSWVTRRRLPSIIRDPRL